MSLTFDPFDSLAVVRSHNFWHWPWVTWNGSQIVPNRIKTRIILPWNISGGNIWLAGSTVFLLWCRASHRLIFAFWCGTYKWTAPVSQLTSHTARSPAGMWSVPCSCDYGEVWNKCEYHQTWSLPSSLQHKQSHTAQQSAMEFSLSSLSKLGSWLLLAPFQVMCPGFLSQEKRIRKGRVLVHVSLGWAWPAAVGM